MMKKKQKRTVEIKIRRQTMASRISRNSYGTYRLVFDKEGRPTAVRQCCLRTKAVLVRLLTLGRFRAIQKSHSVSPHLAMQISRKEDWKRWKQQLQQHLQMRTNRT